MLGRTQEGFITNQLRWLKTRVSSGHDTKLNMYGALFSEYVYAATQLCTVKYTKICIFVHTHANKQQTPHTYNHQIYKAILWITEVNCQDISDDIKTLSKQMASVS